jgi:hypothetical protein
VATQSPQDPEVPLGHDDLCNIIYHQVPPGGPGIAHSHGCRIDTAHDLGIALRPHSGAARRHRAFPTSAGLPADAAGGGAVVPGFDARDVLATIERERITTAMVPVQFQRRSSAEPAFDRRRCRR